ncbi:MAG: TonB-dependent receptor [Phocaeicola sp.]
MKLISNGQTRSVNKQLFRTMKLTLVALFTCIYSLFAADVMSQSAKVSIHANSSTVQKVIKQIELQTDYLFVYDKNDVDIKRKVSVNVNDVPVSEVLNKLFADTDVSYKVIDKNITLTVNRANTAEDVMDTKQNGLRITGKVSDTAGEPIIGANILEKGTTNGAITDVDGNFELSVQSNAILIVSYIGYTTQEVKVTGRTLNITMKDDAEALDEVVVVGYGSMKKKDLTGSVASVNSNVLENRPITNLGTGLQGTIANLNISSSNGRPGTGSSFNIRGGTNISGGSPLILVDGVEMDPNLLNPIDVKDVTVLKDAASASIYGARAAYGVILITTKAGIASRKPIVTLNANYSINAPTTHAHYMNSLEYTQWMNDANTTTNGSNYFDDITMEYVHNYYNDPKNNIPVFHHPDDSDSKWRYCGNTDWYKALNKKSYPMQKYDLSINGGNDNVKYMTSVGMLQQDGISKWADEDYKRFNVLSNVSYQVNNKIKIGFRTNLTMIRQKTGPENKYGSSSLAAILPGDSRPLMPIYHPDGHFSGYSGNGYYTNMAAWLSQGGSSQIRNNSVYATAYAKITPLKGLEINIDYTYNYDDNSMKNHVREYIDYDAKGNPGSIFPHTSPNQVSYSKAEKEYNVFNAYVSFEKKINDVHNLSAMIGFNQENTTYKGIGLSRKNLIVNDIPFLNLATGDRATSDYMNEWALRGAFFRLFYSYADKYLIQVNGRYDGSSRFPKNDRFAFFPTFSLGWRVSQEKFWEPLSNFISDFKLRGSYGSLGNQIVNSYYPYILTYNIGELSYLFDGNKQMSVYAPGLVSDKLTWETVKQWDLGVSFTMLNNHLTGDFDYYVRSTYDMLTKSKTLPSILGTSEPQMNAADLKTRGWELSLTWNSSLDCGLNHSTVFSLSDYQSEITKYDNPTKNLSDSYYVGKKLGEYWGFVTEGLFQTDEEAASWDQSKIVGYTQYAGDIKFADLDGDGKITRGKNTVDDPGDRKIIGNSTPRYNFGLRENVDYKGFDLSIFFQGTMKRDLVLSNSFYLSHYTSEWSVPQKMNYNYWRIDNKDAFYPRARLNGSAVTETQSRFLANGAYIRCKQLSLGYTIPKSITDKMKISKLRVYFNAENLFEFSKMPDSFDPEQSTANAYPFMRAYSLGANLTF